MNASRKMAFAVTILSMFLMSSTVGYAADKEAKKVRICHMDSADAQKGKVLMVSENAVKAHIKHGDPAVFMQFSDGSCELWVEKTYYAPAKK